MEKKPSTPRIVYAANRRIGVDCLRLLLDAGIVPVALVLTDGPAAESGKEMKELLPRTMVIEGKATFAKSAGQLQTLTPEYLMSVHFPLIIPKDILAIPSRGTLNLHPAFLPWNRGWHTPSWAIIDGTPYGATLHWVDEGLDTGPIALQRRIDVLLTDTAHSLYQRALREEEKIFREAIPLLKSGTLPKVPQKGEGTSHKKTDLEKMRRIDRATMSEEEIQRRVRALTTNKPEEAAYREENGERIPLRWELSGQRMPCFHDTDATNSCFFS